MRVAGSTTASMFLLAIVRMLRVAALKAGGRVRPRRINGGPPHQNAHTEQLVELVISLGNPPRST
eukprot:3046078-Lingulodinium_polyedra.AAC.1